MKFFCDTKAFSDAINIVSKAVAVKSPIPHLEGILLTATGGTLTLLSNNLEISIKTSISANISEEGSIVLNSKMLSDIVRKLPEDVCEVTTNEKYNVSIICKNADYKIVGLNADEFPQPPQIAKKSSIKIKSDKLREIIGKTLFAVSLDNARKILTGSLYEIENNVLTVVAVDGYRLALRNQVIPETQYEDLSFVVPGRALNEMLKILKDDATIVEITIRENSVMFAFDTFVITSRLLEGEFMDYNKFIPTNATILVNTDIKKFTSMVERASIIINYDDPKIPIILNIEDNCLNVECISKKGNFDENMEVEHHGDNLKIGIASKLLLDTLKSIDTEVAVFEFNSPQSPCVIKPVEGNGFVYMVLPIRLKG